MDEGICYIETSNLDGETNLKIKQAHPETVRLSNNANSLSEKLGCIECEPPNADLDKFNGKITTPEGKAIGLTVNEVLLRGCILKNTDWITGAVVYTGGETKVMQNALDNRTKLSSLEYMVNSALNFMFLCLIIMVVVSTIVSRVFLDRLESHLYIFPIIGELNFGFETFRMFWSFTILYHNIIPISLYVSMEVVKVFHAMFINSDLQMYDSATGTPASARTSNLSEELGQIDHIFSDKTGTLTRNVMEFMKCSFGGVSYGTGLSDIAKSNLIFAGKDATDLTLTMFPLSTASPGFAFRDPVLHQDLKSASHGWAIRESLLNMCICNTVVPETDAKAYMGIRYEASSPDEATLVDAAKNLGFILEKRHHKGLLIRVPGSSKPFHVELLAINEFNSKRKRMSTIVRLPDGKVRMYLKGADEAIESSLAPNQPLRDITWQHLEKYSNEGLRTLVLAYRDIPSQEFKKWNKMYRKAKTTVQNRDIELEKAAEAIEKDLVLLGATAIEDKLQEGVPETIARLLQAGIRVWVLTGDKKETAINIGYACRLIERGMTLVVVDGNDPRSVGQQLQNANYTISQARSNSYAMVVTGRALKFMTLQQPLAPLMVEICNRCSSVLCCRVSPLQKAEVVNTIHAFNNKIRTLAIGDGANDVSMIQAANVGVGISGKEGMQAVMASDYAIAQFRFLTRLLLVHGRWSYRRIALIIIYSFYKNVVRSTFQFWWQIVSGWSGGTINDVWSLAGWNTFFTALPIIIVSVLEQDISDESAVKVPQLYQHCQKNREFNLPIFVYQMLYAFSTSAACFFLPLAVFSLSDTSPTGQAYGLWDLGFLTFTFAVFICNFRIYLETNFIHWSIHASIWASVLVYTGLMLLYHITSVATALGATEQGGIIYNTWNTWNFWLETILTISVCLFPLYGLNMYQRFWNPHSYQIIQELEQSGDVPDALQIQPVDDNGPPLLSYYMDQVNIASGTLGTPQKHLGFDFSQSAGQVRWLDRIVESIQRGKKRASRPDVEHDVESDQYTSTTEDSDTTQSSSETAPSSSSGVELDPK
eukprot:TRINITY_DN6574_c0_g1_i2.p1 TRINITY_DN6574_c0_g1~~TRINITY_DN6574_c0_g1_i2.p1  ORF type:complete len:1109 (+),score=201.35 TRINITY_DN6574_c0_g1_i2:189-3329(+)